MTLMADCVNIVPPALLPLVPKRFDVIGDIAILSLPDPLIPYACIIARTITTRRKTIRTVVRKVTKVDGYRRVAGFEVITGNSTVTIHRENGFSYRLDLTDVFFAPRLASERKRITSLVQADERVLVPFAGAGPFVVPAAANGGIITAIEMNPVAFRCLEENVAANGVASRTTLIRGDAFDRSLLQKDGFDRAIIPAPYGKDGILWILAPVIRPGGTIHIYTFRKKSEIYGLIAKYRSRKLSVVTYRRCGNVAPGVSRWVFDLCHLAAP
ncbi:MAG TPA: hypothetical protein PLO06_03430 [Methanoregulaceae archaeon]|nr:hypothetical protein [Methanoregulaceae archaeon]